MFQNPLAHFNPNYLRALVVKKPGLNAGATIPKIQSYLGPIKLGGRRLKQYNKICGFSASTDQVPMTFAHVLGFSKHMNNMLSKKFPLNVMGVIHIRNKIELAQPLPADKKLNFQCYVDGHRQTDKGIEFDLMTLVFDQDQLLLRSTSTMLSRDKSSLGSLSAKEHVPFDHPNSESEHWTLPKDLGLKYAQISGDFNPIHLYPAAAKTFGFKTTIIHGMWSLARSLAALESKIPAGPVTLNTEFKLPCFIPAKVMFKHWQEDQVIHYGMLSKDGSRPHIVGTIKEGMDP
jgi:hypothetical protein